METAVYRKDDNAEWKNKSIKQLMFDLQGEREERVFRTAQETMERGMELQSSSSASLRRDEQQEESGHQFFQIGDSVVAYTTPSIEGIIIGIRNGDDRRMELILLVAPDQKKGQAWTKATVCLKDAMKLSKRFPAKFAFPIENSEKIRAEAKTANACPIWITSILEELNAGYIIKERQEARDAHNTRLTTVQPTMVIETTDSRRERRNTESLLPDSKLEELEKRMAEVVALKKGGKKKKSNNSEDSEESDEESDKKRGRKGRARKQKNRRRQDSSSSERSASETSRTSSTSSDESEDRGEVREKGKSGMFYCPFATTDNRGYKNVKVQAKGQSVARKIIRTALHNLYSEYHTMEALATALVTLANASAFKPFSTDVAWLHQYAKYLDGALLNAVNGPWALWNEAWVDEVVMVFLELLVRTSATKEYPTCLDDRVRKWMRKRKVGINPKYGPLPQFMQQAKLTDNGLLLFQGQRNATRDRFPKLSNASGQGRSAGPGLVLEQKKA